MSKYLMIDIGSTFTKLTAVDSEIEDIIGTSAHFTTVQEDVTIGYNNALKMLKEKTGDIKYDRIVACSSAAGGLKMCAIGLIPELTVEAAKRVCLGAGAKVDLVFAGHINKHEVQEIKDKGIDIVLLAGGTDGGNYECILHNSEMLADGGIEIPIIYAGNKSCIDDAEEIFKAHNMTNVTYAENVMPKLNELNIDPARDHIRDVFLKNIISAKGIKKIETEIDKVMLPTPEAVLRSCNLLSKGYMHERGLGELVCVDIGGATTDLYSMCPASAKRPDVVLRGLEEPYAKRTVEGDLGMRYSALGILKSLTEEEIRLIDEDEGIDIEKALTYRSEHVDVVYKEGIEEHIDHIIGGICVNKAMSRHVGRMEEVFTPMGTVYNQYGKDLTRIENVIGTGGVLIHSSDPKFILSKVKGNDKSRLELRPEDPNYLVDKDYILAAMGLLSDIDPLLALRILKKHLVKCE